MTIYDTTDEAALLASALCNVSLSEQKQEAFDSLFNNLVDDKPNLKVKKKRLLVLPIFLLYLT